MASGEAGSCVPPVFERKMVYPVAPPDPVQLSVMEVPVAKAESPVGAAGTESEAESR